MKKILFFTMVMALSKMAAADTAANIFANIQQADQQLRQHIAKQTERFGHDSEQVQQLWQQQTELDTKNQTIIANYLRQHGWPSESQYPNVRASHTVWLVIQHAPLSYQEEFFDLALTAYFNGELHPYSFALLIDRMRVNADKPQIFGSQLQSNEGSKGYHFPAILDKANVNKRRAFVEMDTIEEYAKRNGVDYP